MSNAVCPDYFRRRTIGRAPSPPTWACYEQIPYDDGYSDSGSEDNSCSEDEEDYGRRIPRDSDSDGDHPVVHNANQEPRPDGDMEIDEGDEAVSEEKLAELKKDKGKQRAIEPDNDSPKRQQRKKSRQPTVTLRPILTIQKSQGFVWNQASNLCHHLRHNEFANILAGSIRAALYQGPMFVPHFILFPLFWY